MAIDVNGYLRKKMESSDPTMAEKWRKLHDLYNKRLWHELTIMLMQFVKEPGLQQQQLLIELYDNFIQEFERRIKPLSYVEIAAAVVKQYQAAGDALNFLDKCESRVKSDKAHVDPLALALCKLIRGKVIIEKQNDPAALKVLLEEIDEILTRQIDGITEVHGQFYQLQSKFSLATGNLTEYYKSALKFLGCTPLAKLSQEEQHEHARMLAISALVADKIYNFGELIHHPVLNSLTRTSDEWLVYLLKAVNSGNVKEFDSLGKKWKTNSTLASNESQLRTKVILKAIMETTFERPSNQRQLSFQELSNVTGVKSDQVEGYVMKAIAKGLVGGKIDEVNQMVYMTWVQPRVLDMSQIQGMVLRLNEWHKDITYAQTMVRETNKDVSCTSSEVVL